MSDDEKKEVIDDDTGKTAEKGLEENDENSSSESENGAETKKKDTPVISADLIRGHINTIILRTLDDRDKYGYEIIDEIQAKSHGQYELKQPTLYSALKRLENQGYITAYWKTDEISLGGRRKYYTLTDLGREFTTKNREEWEYTRSVIDTLISDKPYDFDKPAPGAVDFSVLKKSVTRVPTHKINSYEESSEYDDEYVNGALEDEDVTPTYEDAEPDGADAEVVRDSDMPIGPQPDEDEIDDGESFADKPLDAVYIKSVIKEALQDAISEALKPSDEEVVTEEPEETEESDSLVDLDEDNMEDIVSQSEKATTIELGDDFQYGYGQSDEPQSKPVQEGSTAESKDIHDIIKETIETYIQETTKTEEKAEPEQAQSKDDTPFEQQTIEKLINDYMEGQGREEAKDEAPAPEKAQPHIQEEVPSQNAQQPPYPYPSYPPYVQPGQYYPVYGAAPIQYPDGTTAYVPVYGPAGYPYGYAPQHPEAQQDEQIPQPPYAPADNNPIDADEEEKRRQQTLEMLQQQTKDSAQKTDEERKRETHENYMNLINSQPSSQENVNPNTVNMDTDSLLYNNQPAAERNYNEIINGLYDQTIRNSTPPPEQQPYYTDRQQQRPPIAQQDNRYYKAQMSSEVEQNPEYEYINKKADSDGLKVHSAENHTGSSSYSSTYDFGITLMKAGIITAVFLLIMGIIGLVFKSQLGVNLVYGLVIIIIGACIGIGCSLPAILKLGGASIKPIKHWYVGASIVLCLICIIMVCVLAILLNVDFSSAGDIMAKMVLPSICFLALPLFSFSFYTICK